VFRMDSIPRNGVTIPLTMHLEPDTTGNFSVMFGSTKHSETLTAAGRISTFERAKYEKKKRAERMLRYEQLYPSSPTSQVSFVFHVHGMAEGSVSSVVVPLRLLSRVSPKSKNDTNLRKHVTKARCWTGGTHRWTRLITSIVFFCSRIV
jgi:hypothetical protein